MFSHWQSLIANLAVVALFISAWVHGQFVFSGRPNWVRNVAFGLTMGVGAVASMLLAIQIGTGTLFDLRSSLVAISAFFGGPIAALATVVVAVAYRDALGGSTALTGSLGIIVMAGVGLAVSRLTRRRIPAIGSLAVLAPSVAVVTLGLSAVLRTSQAELMVELTLPVALMNMVATALSGFFIMRNRVVEQERDLLRAAFMQSTDFQYVKDTDGRFAIINTTMFRHYGYAHPQDIVGMSDFDFLEPQLADDLFAEEQRLLATGKGFSDREELITDKTGFSLWVSTSKVPLHNAGGKTIGLAGVTRDITSRKALERSVTEGRNQLDYVLSGVSDGIAMFDAEGVLVYCNEQYRQFFPLTADLRVPGRRLAEILQAVAESGEQKGIAAGGEHDWVEEVGATLKVAGEQEIQLIDERWLHVRTRPTAEGAALVVVSEVTKIKQAESALVQLTEQLKLLATTDGLTGLTNRRALDQALETELARSLRNTTPLSLLMIDVDRFKTYNDLYGHQAGDDVLRIVADCLKTIVRRPGDVAARYGGEEFVVVLPGTDEDGALFIADELRETLHMRNVPHRGADKGILTVSIGLATFVECDAGMNAVELVRRADEALYIAKGAGRDRVTGWRPRNEIRPVGLSALL